MRTAVSGRSAVLALLVLVDAVDAHGDGDDQRVVLARAHLDPVSVADAEPLPGNPARDPAVRAGDLPVLVPEVAGGFEPGPVGQADLVAVLERREQGRLYRGDE